MKKNSSIEYKMSKAMFQSLLRDRAENEKKLNPYSYVMNILNEQYRLRGRVTRIIID